MADVAFEDGEDWYPVVPVGFDPTDAWKLLSAVVNGKTGASGFLDGRLLYGAARPSVGRKVVLQRRRLSRPINFSSKYTGSSKVVPRGGIQGGGIARAKAGEKTQKRRRVLML